MGFGASVAKLTALGHNVAMLDLTNGEPTPHGDPATRAREAARAAKILGVKTRITLDLPNREVVDSIAARRQVAAVYRELRPEIVFLQGTVDAHPDHIDGVKLAEKARFDAKLTKTEIPGQPWYPKKVFRYLASHLRLNPRPSFILDVSDTFETKMEAVRAYKSQFAASDRERWVDDTLRRMAWHYGRLIGVEYGEPVMCDEQTGLRDIRDLVV